jgi:hypothetical protein
MKTLACALALAFLLAGSTVLAQPRRGAGTGRAEGQIPITVYREGTFTDDIVRGDLSRPDGNIAWGRTRRPLPFLLTIREHFVNEMLKSVENQ